MSKRLTIKQDENCESPRTSCDNVWTFACWHNKYHLGDIQPKNQPSEFIEGLSEGTIIRSIFAYEHGNITISLAEFSCPWDSGQVGYAYVTPEKIKEEYGDGPEALQKALNYLEGEIRVYDDYLQGNCWMYKVEEGTPCQCCDHIEYEMVDSCGGFIGDDLERTGLKDYLTGFTPEEITEAWDKRFN